MEWGDVAGAAGTVVQGYAGGCGVLVGEGWNGRGRGMGLGGWVWSWRKDLLGWSLEWKGEFWGGGGRGLVSMGCGTREVWEGGGLSLLLLEQWDLRHRVSGRVVGGPLISPLIAF